MQLKEEFQFQLWLKYLWVELCRKSPDTYTSLTACQDIVYCFSFNNSTPVNIQTRYTLKVLVTIFLSVLLHFASKSIVKISNQNYTAIVQQRLNCKQMLLFGIEGLQLYLECFTKQHNVKNANQIVLFRNWTRSKEIPNGLISLSATFIDSSLSMKCLQREEVTGMRFHSSLPESFYVSHFSPNEAKRCF